MHLLNRLTIITKETSDDLKRFHRLSDVTFGCLGASFPGIEFTNSNGKYLS